MKKKIFLVLMIFCIIAIIMMLTYFLMKYKKRVEILEERTAGISVTMLGGSNMPENGNINSCGFVIRSKNQELILVDGGRDIDADLVLEYIKKYGNGTVNHWFITHAHTDHVGALLVLLEREDITIENIYYSFNSLEWYEKYDKRGFETEEKMINQLNNPKIKNKIECKKNQIINIDNIDCQIIRVANPEAISSDSGNDSSMIFKMVATDVNKSIIFLGDAYTYTTKELLKEPEKLKADAVQMSHHGQYGVNEEVYRAIHPEVGFFNAPEFLYNNDNGGGYNSGTYQSVIVRGWMKDMGSKCIPACYGDRTIRFTNKGIEY